MQKRRETIALKAITDTDNGSLYVSASLKEGKGKLQKKTKWKIEKLSNELKMIFGCLRVAGESSLFIRRIIQSRSVIKTYVTQKIIFCLSPRLLLIGLNFFFAPGFNSSIMQNTFYAREPGEKNLSHVHRYFFPSRWRNYFLCMLQNRYHNLIPSPTKNPITFYYD